MAVPCIRGAAVLLLLVDIARMIWPPSCSVCLMRSFVIRLRKVGGNVPVNAPKENLVLPDVFIPLIISVTFDLV